MGFIAEEERSTGEQARIIIILTVFSECFNRDFKKDNGRHAEICTKLQIENCKLTKLNKKDYRQVITDAGHKMNKLRLRAQAKGKEKCDRIMRRIMGKKHILADCRLWNKYDIVISSFIKCLIINY